nr:VWA domain-containing protein [uncultured Butyrivibrio sp.]
MKNNATEIVYILDRSGSMRGLEADTIGGFNSMMNKQKETGENAIVTTVLFDDAYEVLHDRVSLESVGEMTEKQYYVRGCTALLDAVGETIHHIVAIHKSTPKEELPKKTIFIITTDGMENASVKYSYDKVKKMVKKQQNKRGWEFVFIGANIDSYAESEKLGVKKNRTVNYVHDEVGTKKVYAGVTHMLCNAMRADDDCEYTCLDTSNWANGIKDDFKQRGRRSCT